MDQRLQQLHQWLTQQLNDASLQVTPVSGDASFRRYFRVTQRSTDERPIQQWIAMDAPPEKEDSEPFVAIARHWEAQGIQVPHIHACDLAKGFMLLGDFGDTLMLSAINPSSTSTTTPDIADITTRLYQSALETLVRIQQCSQPENFALPPYDTALLSREMELFREWLISQKLAIQLSASEHQLLDQTFQYLIDAALSQPVVCVHRDYHSRNLMDLQDQSIGVLDFQDAVMGPITYDLVSLLRDCYWVLPPSFIEQRLHEFHHATQDANLHGAPLEQFKQWFDLMGIQRHLKAAGIFARLSLRDGKHDYLNDVPRTVRYIEQVSANYDELQAFNQWLNATVIPVIDKHLCSGNSLCAETAITKTNPAIS